MDIKIRKNAASRLGLSVEQYREKVQSGLKWCSGCKQWHTVNKFNKDLNRSDGLATICREYNSKWRKSRRIYKVRISKRGCRYALPRDGDKLQANARINTLIKVGLLPKPNDCPCADCRHIYAKGERRHEYHHDSYTVDQQEIVIVLCSKCHHKRHPR